MCRRVLVAVAASAAATLLANDGALASDGPIQEFPIPSGRGACVECTPKYGADIAVGPDGALWVTEWQVDRSQNRGRISRMTTDGTVTAQYLAPDGVRPDRITAGPDGAMWFSAPSGSIGRLTTGGEFTIYPAAGFLMDIVPGPDGALWFTDLNSGVGRITTGGKISKYPVSGGGYRITVGPDGALWFTTPPWTGTSFRTVSRMTTEGRVEQFSVPCNGCRAGASFGLSDITAGPDGALWFGEDGGDYGPQRIARMTTDGTLAGEFPVSGRRPSGLVAGPDGAIWFTESGRAEGDDGRIGRVTMAGEVQEYQLPTSRSWPIGIAAGPDGNLWVMEYAAAQVARIPTDPTAPTPPPTPVPSVTLAGPLAFTAGLAVAGVAVQTSSRRRARRSWPFRGRRHGTHVAQHPSSGPK